MSAARSARPSNSVGTPWRAAALLLGCALMPTASGGKLQCWTDESGRTACGDAVPPKAVKNERRVFDETGRELGTRPREKTAEEIAAERDLRALNEELAKRARDRKAYDRFLVQTYESVGDLQAARDERLAMIDGRTRLVSKSVGDAEKTLAGLNERLQTAQAAGKPEHKDLRPNIAASEREIADGRTALARLAEERGQTCSSFGNDIARYIELKNLTDQDSVAAAACPEPAASQTVTTEQ